MNSDFFVKVHSDLLKRTDISSTRKLVLSYLIFRSEIPGWTFNASNIANTLGLSYDTAQRETKALEQERVIQCTGYTSTFPQRYKKYVLARIPQNAVSRIPQNAVSRMPQNAVSRIPQNAALKERIGKEGIGKEGMVKEVSTKGTGSIDPFDLYRGQVQQALNETVFHYKLSLPSCFDVDHFARWIRTKGTEFSRLNSSPRKFFLEQYLRDAIPLPK